MLKSYLVIAFRNFIKNKTFSIINLIGLIISLTAFLLISLYIQYELSFDRYHKNANQIYRVWSNGFGGGWALSPAPLATFMEGKYLQIKNTVRIAQCDKVLIKSRDKVFNETRLIAVDPSIFDIFTFPLVNGDPKTVLNKPNSVVITESTALKYFGKENPIGEILKVNHKTDLVVTGVLKDIPNNSHFHFDFLASIEATDYLFWKGFLDNRMNTVVYTYIQLQNNTDQASFQKEIVNLEKDYLGQSFGGNFQIQAITDIHLKSHFGGEFEENSDTIYIYIFSIVAILVLLMACINYTNLSLALYSTRIREVGVRKVFGSSRRQLTAMFYLESLVMLFLSLNFAFILIKLLLPWFAQFINRPLEATFYNGYFYWGVLLLVPIIAMLSGGYPALYITKFKAISIQKGQSLSYNNKFGLKQILVFIQFVFSIALIIATIAILRQVNYIKSKNLGFSKDALVLVPLSDINMAAKWEIYKSELLQNPKVLSVAGISDIPGEMTWVCSIFYEGMPADINPPTMTYLRVDKDFIKTFQLKITDGSDFSKINTNEGEQEYILNQAAVKFLDWKNPIGKQFESNTSGKGKVIGEVNDFHYKSLHTQIEPLFLAIDSKNFNYLSVRINSENIHETIPFIQNKWKELSDGSPFEYYLYDRYLDKLYKPEILLGRITLIFSFLTIIITCLGLFGLTSFIVFRRTKEIGIRKVNGATIKSILLLLSKDFTKWVFFAFIIACPIAYLIMNKWLQNFAYKAELSWWIFALAGFIAIVVALLAITWQSWRAANRNPVEALRYE